MMARLLLLVVFCILAVPSHAENREEFVSFKVRLQGMAFNDPGMDDVCKMLGPQVPFPGIEPGELCGTTGFDIDNGTCRMLGMVEKGLSRVAVGNSSSVCKASLQRPVSATSLSGMGG